MLRIAIAKPDVSLTSSVWCCASVAPAAPTQLARRIRRSLVPVWPTASEMNEIQRHNDQCAGHGTERSHYKALSSQVRHGVAFRREAERADLDDDVLASAREERTVGLARFLR